MTIASMLGGTMLLVLILLVVLIVLLGAALFIVPQQQAYIIERFGKFLRSSLPVSMSVSRSSTASP